MRAVKSGRFMGSVGQAAPGRRPGSGRAQDATVLRAGILGLRGLSGVGLGLVASGSASGSGSSSSGETDWAGIIGAATTGAASIIDSARKDTSSGESVGSTSAPLYQPAYTPPPTQQQAPRQTQWVSGVSNGVVLLGGAAVLLGGLYLLKRK